MATVPALSTLCLKAKANSISAFQLRLLKHYHRRVTHRGGVKHLHSPKQILQAHGKR